MKARKLPRYCVLLFYDKNHGGDPGTDRLFVQVTPRVVLLLLTPFTKKIASMARYISFAVLLAIIVVIVLIPTAIVLSMAAVLVSKATRA